MKFPNDFVDQIIHGDCLDVMKHIPDKSIKMILCDLPYGQTDNAWDSEIPLADLWAAYQRIVMPDTAIVLTGIQPFTSRLISSNLGAFKYEWVWAKNKATGFLNAKIRPMRSHENVLVFSYGKPPYNPVMFSNFSPIHGARSRGESNSYGEHKGTITVKGATLRYPSTILHFPVVNNDSLDRVHPAQKPIGLFEYLIRTYTDEGDLVLDNCIGSGTTGIAALRTGRHFIGIESSGEYSEAARVRIAEHQEQLSLF